MTEPTTVPGHVAISGNCPHCGALNTEHAIQDSFVQEGGSLDFTCSRCVGKFKVNWTGLNFGGETIY